VKTLNYLRNELKKAASWKVRKRGKGKSFDLS
jgi:hypothetical protein